VFENPCSSFCSVWWVVDIVPAKLPRGCECFFTHSGVEPSQEPIPSNSRVHDIPMQSFSRCRAAFVSRIRCNKPCGLRDVEYASVLDRNRFRCTQLAVAPFKYLCQHVAGIIRLRCACVTWCSSVNCIVALQPRNTFWHFELFDPF
jgi:hypothetical protein